jgi:hypothetical protein
MSFFFHKIVYHFIENILSSSYSSFVVATLSGILGNVVGYWFGSKKWLLTTSKIVLVQKKIFSSVKRFFEKYGGKTIIFARFLQYFELCAYSLLSFLWINRVYVLQYLKFFIWSFTLIRRALFMAFTRKLSNRFKRTHRTYCYCTCRHNSFTSNLKLVQSKFKKANRHSFFKTISPLIWTTLLNFPIIFFISNSLSFGIKAARLRHGNGIRHVNAYVFERRIQHLTTGSNYRTFKTVLNGTRVV